MTPALRDALYQAAIRQLWQDWFDRERLKLLELAPTTRVLAEWSEPTKRDRREVTH